jgi:transcriptional regulator with XRE-family HTH domain
VSDEPELDSLPPFDPAAARTARTLMAFTPERVAASLASYGVNVFPGDVRAWEDGTRTPSEHELIGLAQALAVSVDRLMGETPVATLQSCRLRAGLTRAQAGRSVAMSEASWTRMENANCWRADEMRTKAMVRVLGGLSHRQLVEVSGGADELAALLALTLGRGRVSAYLARVNEILGTKRRRTAEALEALCLEFPPGTAVPEDAEIPLPKGAVDRFWALLGDPAADPYAPGVWRRPPRRS